MNNQISVVLQDNTVGYINSDSIIGDIIIGNKYDIYLHDQNGLEIKKTGKVKIIL